MARGVLDQLLQESGAVLRISAARALNISAPTAYAFARSHGLKQVSKGI